MKMICSFLQIVFFICLLPVASMAATPNQVNLTAQEKAFLQAHPKIIFGTEKSWEPYVIVQADGSVTGFNAEILSRINALTGANFQLKVGVWREMQKETQDRKIDGLSTGTTLFLAQKKGLPSLKMSMDLQAPLELPFGVRKDWPEAISILNKGLTAIPQHERLLIYNKWFPDLENVNPSSDMPILLHPDEQDWLRNHQVIRVHAVDTPPYFFHDNEPQGILVDLLELVESRFGFRLEYIDHLTWSDAVKSIKNHQQVDVLLGLHHTPERDKFLKFSQESVELPWVIFTREDERSVFSLKDLAGKTVVIERGFVAQKLLNRKYPRISQLQVDSTVDALRALSENQADAYIGNLTVSQYYIVRHGLNNLKVAAPTDFDDRVHTFAVRDDWSTLATIIDKGLAAITPEERSAINRKYFSVNVESGMDLVRIFWVFLGLSLFFLFILFWNYRLQREVRIRRETEQALSKSEELFRAIFENVPAFIDSFDKNGKCTLWNNACEKIYGWTKDEINATENPMSLFYPDPEIRDRVVKSLRDNVGTEFTKWHPQNKNGDVLTTRWNNFRISDGTVIGFGIDETMLEEQTTELRKLSRAVEQSHSTIVITDLNGNIEFVNPAFSRSTGYTQEEAIGQNSRILMSGQQDTAIYQDLWETLHKGAVWQGELHNKRKDGSLYWEFATISPVKNEQEKTTHYVAVKENITERKLAEQRLIEAQQQAEEANRSKSNFLANMSHEIRTPMSAIIGMSYLTLQTNLSHKQQDYVNKIDFAANSLLRIINDILDLSKIEAGKLELEAIPFRLTDMVDNLSSLITVIAKEQKLALNITVAPDVPPCLVGDPFRLGQILLNLCNNAVKFTGKGGIAVRVDRVDKGMNTNADQVLLQFSVTDTGIGMTKKQLADLFQSFSQADSSTTRKYGGTGLGLSICKQLVELMNGKIRAESQLGKGSTFSFSLQFGIADIASLTTESAQVVDHTALAAIRGARILLVEDNLFNQQVARELLEMEQMVVTIANDGQEAVEAVKHHSFDAILMDIQMPVMDGHTATNEIRKDPAFADLPIIAMTANVMVADCQRCFDAGMNDHVAKPINPDTLFQALVRWIPAQKGIEAGTVAQVSPVENDLPVYLPGINLELGLRHTAGSSKLLRKLMRQFYQQHGQNVRLIREALEEDEMEKAQRIAHTAKGVAGTIGAEDLQQAATAVDAALEAGSEEEIPALLENMDLALLEVMHGLESICADPEETAVQETTREFDIETASSLLDEMQNLVQKFDSEAEEKAITLVQLLVSSQHHEVALDLLNQIEDTEFDAAKETIRLMQGVLFPEKT